MKKNHIPKLLGRAGHLWGSLLIATTFLFASCANDADNNTSGDSTDMDNNNGRMNDTSLSMAKLEPKGPDPDWGKSIKDEMLVVMEK